MIPVTLIRIKDTGKATLGHIHVGSISLMCIERPWLNNERMISCIPLGKYLLERVKSPKFGNVFEIKHVPNRDKILIHIANKASELHGCVAPGLRFGELDGEDAVLQSRLAFTHFMKELEGIDSTEIHITSGY